MIRLALVGFLALVASVSYAGAEAKLRVVVTFSIFGDFVQTVGGDRVIVDTLVGPDADTHAYTPKPTDVKKLAAAKIVVMNGLGFESWIDRLIATGAVKSKITQASDGVIRLNEAADAPNPHAWQSVQNAKVYVANIQDALIAADPDLADIYRANAAAYSERLERLDQDIRAVLSTIPDTKRRIVIPHPFLAYFGKAYGMDIQSPQHLNREAEISAKAVAEIVTSIRRDRISAVFFENAGDPRLMQQIAKETGVRIGGPLYSDSLTGPSGPAPTYIAMMQQNLRTITDALRDRD